MSALVLAAIAGPLIGLCILMSIWLKGHWSVLSVAERIATAAIAITIGTAGWAILIYALNLEAASS